MAPRREYEQRALMKVRGGLSLAGMQKKALNALTVTR